MFATLLFAGFMTSLTSVQYAGGLAHIKRTTTLTIGGEALDAEGAKQVLEKSAATESTPSYVLWEERGQEALVNPALARTTKVNVVLAKGDIGLLISGAFLPEQTLPSAMGEEPHDAQKTEASSLRASSTNETNLVAISEIFERSAHASAKQTCIIDRETALELFGDVQIVGLPVNWDNQEFRVDAVLESARPLLIIRPTEQSGIAFNMLTAENHSGLSSATFGEELASSLGIVTEVLEYDLLYHLGYLIAWLPTLLIALVYEAFLLVQGCSKRNEARLQTFYLLGFLITLVALTMFVAMTIEFPREFIPSRFSDFSLWHQIQEDTGSAFRLLFDAAVYAPLASLFDSFYLVLVFSVVSLFLYVGSAP